MEVEKNFFVQNFANNPMNLEQPYIMAMKMETKVLDDGSHHTKIKNYDSKS